jgi:hypothetical protein
MNTRPLHLASWCLTGALAFAAPGEPQQGGTGGGTGGGGSRDGNRRFEHGGGPGPGFGGRGGFGEPSPEDWQKYKEQLKAFCLQHSPRRWQEIEERAQRPGTRMRILSMSGKFKELQKYEKEDPTLYGIKVRQIEVEDAEYGLITDLKALDKSDEKGAADLRAKLRQQNGEYVKLRLQERAHRIDRLNRMIQREKEQLAADQQGVDRLADERLADLEKQGPDFFLPRWGRRPDGENPSTTSTTPAPSQPPANANPGN